MDLSKFHVISVVSNPILYQSRYDLHGKFAANIQRKGATLWTLEMATGARFHRVTEAGSQVNIQLWNSAIPGELWHKENLINTAIQHLTRTLPDWRYVAWVDADVMFEENFIEKTANALQHWDLVQMWSHAIDYGPNEETIKVHESYMYCYWTGKEPASSNGYTRGGHPGFAWAARRDALNKLGGLIDFGALGSGDRHMATALVGRVKESVHGDMHPTYHRWLEIWQQRAEVHLRRNIGYVPGTIRHLWHGRKADRGYSSRWRILVDHQFNPETDLKRDVSGLWQLVSETPRQTRLRDEIRRYFRARKEDATTTS